MQGLIQEHRRSGAQQFALQGREKLTLCRKGEWGNTHRWTCAQTTDDWQGLGMPVTALTALQNTLHIHAYTAQERAQISPGAWHGPHSSSPEGSSATCMSEPAAHQHLLSAHSPLSAYCEQAPDCGFTDTSVKGGIHTPFRLVDKQAGGK